MEDQVVGGLGGGREYPPSARKRRGEKKKTVAKTLVMARKDGGNRGAWKTAVAAVNYCETQRRKEEKNRGCGSRDGTWLVKTVAGKFNWFTVRRSKAEMDGVNDAGGVRTKSEMEEFGGKGEGR